MKELKDQKLKKYFTQIPNYILESFSIWDREVYVQIKKIAGEDGICWTSQKTLAKQSGMSVNRLKESIKNLLLNKLIEKIGFRKVMTKGGPQKIPEYKIINIWEMNIKYYEDKKGVSSGDTPSMLTSAQKRSITEGVIGVAPDEHKEELYLIRTQISSLKRSKIIKSSEDG